MSFVNELICSVRPGASEKSVGSSVAAIAQQAVGGVLDDQKAMLFGERGDALSLRAGAGRAGRVLEVRDDVEELRRVLGQRRFERLEVRAVGLERDAHDRGVVAAKERQRPVVGRRFDEHHVARLHHLQAQELDQLERAVAGQHAVDARALPLGDELAQRLEPGRRAVLHHRRAVRFERRAGGVDDFLDRKRIIGGNAAGEVDHGRLLGHAGLNCFHWCLGCVAPAGGWLSSHFETRSAASLAAAFHDDWPMPFNSLLAAPLSMRSRTIV